MSAKEIKCIYCKGTHGKIIEGDSYICEYCGGLNYITTSDIDFKFSLASNNLSLYKFDEADDIYKRILEDSPNYKVSSMALMGRLLSYFGIVYVKSYGSNVTTPTFAKYNPEIQSIKSSRYYKQLCNLNLPSFELEKYKKQVEELDKVYTRIDSDLNETPEYDVFICTKISAQTKNHPEQKGYTEDSRLATELYYMFKNKGLRVFYSDKVLKGVEYDSQIYSALSKSKTILVIASSKEYLESVWVESEWRRWLNFIEVGARNRNTFLLHLIDKSIEVPSILQKAQVIDYYNIYDTIDSIVNKDKKKEDKNQAILDELKKIQEENARRQQEIEEANKKRIQELEEENKRRQKEIQEENARRQQELEEEIKKRNNNSNNGNVPAGHIHSWVTKVYAPTCSQEGYTEYKCPECGLVKKDDFKPTLPHDFKSTVVPSTCVKEGYTTYKCSKCGFTKTETKPVSPHLYEFSTKQPTCSTEGYTLKTCKTCGVQERINITPKTPHTFKKQIIFGPTCTREGLEEEKCINCGFSRSKKTLGKTLHNIEDGVCKDCGKRFYSQRLDFKLLDDNTWEIHGFYNNERDIIIPETYDGKKVTQINSLFFYQADENKITKITIPNSIKYIGNDKLRELKNLHFSIYENAKYLGNDSNPYLVLFEAENIEITKCRIHPDTKVIAELAFEKCEQIEEIIIPNGVKSICDYAFRDCIKLKSITIPSTVEKIGEAILCGCPNVEIINFDKNNQYYKYIDNTIFTKNGRVLIQYTSACSTEELVIPEGVVEILRGAFSGAKNLKRISIPSTISKIEQLGITNLQYNEYKNGCYLGNSKNPYLILVKTNNKKIKKCIIHNDTKIILNRAFNECTKLKTVQIPNKVISIGTRAFSECTKLKNIVIPDSVKIIEGGAFENCSSLEKIMIPKSVKEIGYNPFKGCIKLTYINVDSANPNYKNYNGHIQNRYDFYDIIKAPGKEIQDNKNKEKENKDKAKVDKRSKKEKEKQIKYEYSKSRTYVGSKNSLTASEMLLPTLSIILSIVAFACSLYFLGEGYADCAATSNCLSFINVMNVESGTFIFISVIIVGLGVLLAVINNRNLDNEKLDVFSKIMLVPATIITTIRLLLYLAVSALMWLTDCLCGWMVSIDIPIFATIVLIFILRNKTKNL